MVLNPNNSVYVINAYILPEYKDWSSFTFTDHDPFERLDQLVSTLSSSDIWISDTIHVLKSLPLPGARCRLSACPLGRLLGPGIFSTYLIKPISPISAAYGNAAANIPRYSLIRNAELKIKNWIEQAATSRYQPSAAKLDADLHRRAVLDPLTVPP